MPLAEAKKKKSKLAERLESVKEYFSNNPVSPYYNTESKSFTVPLPETYTDVDLLATSKKKIKRRPNPQGFSRIPALAELNRR